jgi:hypothetical protein
VISRNGSKPHVGRLTQYWADRTGKAHQRNFFIRSSRSQPALSARCVATSQINVLLWNHLRFSRPVRTVARTTPGSRQGDRSGNLTSSSLIKRCISIRVSNVTQSQLLSSQAISVLTQATSLMGLKAECRETKERVENVGPQFFCKSCDSPILMNFQRLVFIVFGFRFTSY